MTASTATAQRFYLRGTIHLADAADGPIQDAYCGNRLIGAIDTEADATCPRCLRHAAELADSDALDAMRDEEQEAELENTEHAAELAREQAPRSAYPASVGGGQKIHAALAFLLLPLNDGDDLGATEIACGAGRRSFTSVGYAFAPTIRLRPGQAIDCQSCLRSIAARSIPLGAQEPAQPAAEPPSCSACRYFTGHTSWCPNREQQQPAAEHPMAAADPGAGIAIDSEPQPAEEEAGLARFRKIASGNWAVLRSDGSEAGRIRRTTPDHAGFTARWAAFDTAGIQRATGCLSRTDAAASLLRALAEERPAAQTEPEALGEQQSPLHQRAIIEALPMPPGEGGEHVRATIWEADLATRQGEPRELIGCDARDLRAGDIIVSAGCEHRDFRGCQHRLFAAFDLLLQDGEAGERITIWTAIADQEAGQPPRLTMPAGRRLLVQRRLPDWKIAEAPSFAASIIDLAMPELPLLCGPAGNLARGGDLNSDWTCRRARALWGAHRRADELQEECARLDRMRSERRRRGLADWIARAFVRYEALDRRLLRELPPCGHPEGLRREMSVEEALPACTC